MTTRHLIFCFLLLLPTILNGQSRTISGSVSDMNDEPLAGVNIMVQNTKTGTMSDSEGNFSIKVPQAGGATLVFSFIGMETTIIKVTDNDIVLTVRMKESELSIEQTVITGYSQTTTKRITGSVGILSSKDLEDKPQSSIDALLKGQLAGVSVSATTGQPGRSQKISIRGQSTLTGNSSPLWVVDGVPLQGELPNVYDSQLKTGGLDDLFVNGIGEINPNDIENISILKDASAAAIYGSRAANGVIVITTKRGSDGPAHVNYSGNISITLAPQRSGNLMDSAEKTAWEDELWNEFSAEKYAAGQIYPIVGIVGMIRSGYGDFSSIASDKNAQDRYISELSKQTTDWFDLIFRNSISTNHHINLSGGGQKYNYYVALATLTMPDC